MDEQVVETKVQETLPQTQPENVAQQILTSEPESQQQIDWKRFKEARKKEREQKEEAERIAVQKTQETEALKAALEAIVNKPSYQQTTQSEDPEDDVIQKKIDHALANERKRQDELQRQREQAEFPMRLKASCPDFNEVCSRENLDYIDFHHPEAAQAMNDLPEGLDKWTKIYRAVKRYVPNATTSGKEAKKAEKNLGKPQAMSGAGRTSTGDVAPQNVTAATRQANWERMVRTMKSVR